MLLYSAPICTPAENCKSCLASELIVAEWLGFLRSVRAQISSIYLVLFWYGCIHNKCPHLIYVMVTLLLPSSSVAMNYIHKIRIAALPLIHLQLHFSCHPCTGAMLNWCQALQLIIFDHANRFLRVRAIRCSSGTGCIIIICIQKSVSCSSLDSDTSSL